MQPSPWGLNHPVLETLWFGGHIYTTQWQVTEFLTLLNLDFGLEW